MLTTVNSEVKACPTIPLTSITLPRLEGTMRAPGDFQKALLESTEPIKPTRAVPILMMEQGGRPVAEVCPYHDCILLNVGSMIRQCYFIILTFHEWHKADIE